MQWINPKTKGWGWPNLVHNAKERTSKAKQKDEMNRQMQGHPFVPKPAQNLKHAWCESKTMLKCWKMNNHAIHLKCYIEINLFPFLQTTWKGGHKPPRAREKIHVPTSIGLRKGIDQNY
jgi:hypothetical protein